MSLFAPTGSIRRRVLAAVEARIKDGQVQYDQECSKQDSILYEGISALTAVNREAKVAAEERIVASIIN